MRKALLTLALLAVLTVALAGPAGRLVNQVDVIGAPISQHAEVIIDPPGGG